MSWIELVLAVAVSSGIIMIPGLVLATLLGLRGLWVWGLAAPFGVTAVAVSSTVAPFLGIDWSIWPLLGGTALLAVLIVLVRLIVIRRVPGAEWRIARPDGDGAHSARIWHRLATPIALIIAGMALSAQVVAILGSPGAISQTYDNIFHLNAVRFMLDTANGSSLNVGLLTSPESSFSFYPAVWHAIAAMTVQLSGVSIPVVENALALVTAAVVWPAGVVLLTRALFGTHTVLMLTAGLVAAVIPAFPIAMMVYGVLYPFQLGIALVPAILAAGIALFGLGHAWAGAPWQCVLAVLGSLPGLVLAHPSAFVAWLVLFSLTVLIGFIRYLRSRPRARARGFAIVGFLGYLAVAFVLWRLLRPPPEARFWPPTESIPDALREALTLSLFGAPASFAVAICVFFGVLALLWVRSSAAIWTLAAGVITVTLYVAVSAFPWPVLRDLLTANWYNNAPRLAALVPLVVVPLAAYGVFAVSELIRARTHRRILGVAAILVAVALVGMQLQTVRAVITGSALSYELSDHSPLLSTDERALLEQVPELVPEDAVIVGDPATGTALAYGLADRRVLLAHTLVTMSDDAELIVDELDEGTPAVCQAISRADAEYVLDFGGPAINSTDNDYPGLDQLAQSSAVDLVSEVGDARLYRVVGC